MHLKTRTSLKLTSLSRNLISVGVPLTLQEPPHSLNHSKSTPLSQILILDVCPFIFHSQMITHHSKTMRLDQREPPHSLNHSKSTPLSHISILDVCPFIFHSQM